MKTKTDQDTELKSCEWLVAAEVHRQQGVCYGTRPARRRAIAVAIAITKATKALRLRGA